MSSGASAAYARHPREGGDPATSMFGQAKALDPRLRGDDGLIFTFSRSP